MWEDNGSYNVRATGARLIVSNVKGTPGLEIDFQSEDDPAETIKHTIWLTEATRERASKDLALLGFIVGKNDFRDVEAIVSGKTCSVVTGREFYKDQEQIRVRWINPPKANGDRSPADIANQLFGIATPARGKVKAPRKSAPSEAYADSPGGPACSHAGKRCPNDDEKGSCPCDCDLCIPF